MVALQLRMALTMGGFFAMAGGGACPKSLKQVALLFDPMMRGVRSS